MNVLGEHRTFLPMWVLVFASLSNHLFNTVVIIFCNYKLMCTLHLWLLMAFIFVVKVWICFKLGFRISQFLCA